MAALHAGIAFQSAPGSVALLEGQDAVRAFAEFADADRHGRPGNVFQSRAMLDAAARAAVSAGNPALAVCVFRGDTMRTIWPLRIIRDMGVNVATDLADPINQYSDVLGEPMDGAALTELGERLSAGFKADVLLARRVRADSGLDAGFTECGAVVIDRNAAPFVDLSAHGNFASYLASFSKSTARKIRQRRSRLESDHGALSFEVLQADAARETAQRAVSWKRNWLSAQALSSRVFDGALNEAALIEASAARNAHVSVLRAGARPVAIELGFSCGSHYAAYLGTFDPEFAGYSAGQEQMLRSIDWCFANGFKSYDLLPPDDDYKRHWTRGDTAIGVSDYGLALSHLGSVYLPVRKLARARVQRAIDAMPSHMRQVVWRGGAVAAGAGAAAVVIRLIGMIAE